MAILIIGFLMLVMTGQASCNWCVCKDLPDAQLQKTLDFACGAGADCNPIHSSGACYQPNTVRAHCNYAVNSYFQKMRQVEGSCLFSGTAAISTSDPSYTGCSFPATVSAAGTSTTTTPSTNTPITTNPSTNTPSTTNPSTTPTTTTPYSTTPNNGVLGGIGNGVSPAGTNTDFSDAAFRIPNSSFSAFILSSLVSSLMLLWG